MTFQRLTAWALLLAGVGCTNAPESSSTKSQLVADMKRATDHHSYSKPEEAVTTHLNWDAKVDFESRTVHATAHYDIQTSDDAERILLDARDLTIQEVLVDGVKTEFELGPERPFVGQPLSIPLSPEAKQISVTYTTSPDAAAFLWVEGESPFLFTQSQAILARSWVPCQDSPGIRFTYEAKVEVPSNLMALMSATNPTEKSNDGIYRFAMNQPIPSYLLALAVGDVEFRSVGEHTGVYATPDLIDDAEYEFAEMEDMLVAAEKLYGAYAWERYDLLVLPAAFPFGGMENPRLTFATPTIIAGDRSLVSLVAHELAHSWSGNLVTNATWDDFWLNEGFTVYFEQRIMESVYGRDISEMLSTLSYQGLVDEVDAIMDVNPNDTHLRLHLKDRDPDDGMTAIAYDKGYFFLRLLEETVGRETFDSFLKNYFETHAFQVMDTDQFLTYLDATLLTTDELRATVNVTAWVDGQGLPNNCPKVSSSRIERVDATLQGWVDGSVASGDLPWDGWMYQERYRFLSNLPDDTQAARLAELDAVWGINDTGNNEVLFAWLEQSIRSGHKSSYGRLRSFLVKVGRRKFLTPLYKALVESDQKDLALDIYREARGNYHSVSTGTMDELLGWSE
ncbi:MAG: M1 family metallopeptidase [Flavobacteriales bacterium]